jgi:hypothetical protein
VSFGFGIVRDGGMSVQRFRTELFLLTGNGTAQRLEED